MSSQGNVKSDVCEDERVDQRNDITQARLCHALEPGKAAPGVRRASVGGGQNEENPTGIHIAFR